MGNAGRYGKSTRRRSKFFFCLLLVFYLMPLTDCSKNSAEKSKIVACRVPATAAQSGVGKGLLLKVNSLITGTKRNSG